MRRAAVLTVLLPLLMLVQAGPATAGVSCHQINATGAGRGLHRRRVTPRA